jgi:hypothetical protein
MNMASEFGMLNLPCHFLLENIGQGARRGAKMEFFYCAVRANTLKR